MAAESLPLAGYQILVVDDEEYICQFLIEALTQVGARVLTASSGATALAVIAEQRVDLLLTDLNMPEMDGLQLLAQVRTMVPPLQVIVISGQDDLDLAVKAMELGANRYLRKPLQLNELTMACLRALEKGELLLERGRLDIRLQQAQKMEAVGQLAAGIAHEINTPTQYVGSNIDFLAEAFTDLAEVVNLAQEMIQQALAAGAGLTAAQLAQLATGLEEADWPYLAAEIPKALSQSREGVGRVSEIVRAMKEFSHPGTKDKALVDLNHIIQTTVTVARNEWKYVADLQLDLEDGLPVITALAGEIGQVLLNILVNGAHAIAEKMGDNPAGQKGKIVISSHLQGEMVEVRVSDSGCGIPEAIRQRIFEPFFTTKEVGKGTGQGLAIAYDVVVHKHGGKLSLESVEGEGSTFIISLPVDGGEGD